MLNNILSLVVEEKIPAQLSRRITRFASGLLSAAIKLNDRMNLRSGSPKIGLKIIDGCHGGIPLWDWILLPGGGLWSELFWPTVLGTIIHRARKFGISAVLELDAYTIEVMGSDPTYDLSDLRELCKMGLIEIVNGTYTQPFFQTISEESCIRQFSEGLDIIHETLETTVISYGTQEPSFFVQLPQIIQGLGFKNAILRTHWAAFGTEPAFDTDYFFWTSPDGSRIRTIPRYSTMDYSRLVGDINHPGIVSGGLAFAGGRDDYPSFQKSTIEKGIDAPVWTQFVDVFESPSKVSQIKLLEPVTIQQYFANLDHNPAYPSVCLHQDDLPQPLPWGLHADELIRHRSQAEKVLLHAEYEDADLFWKTGQSNEKELQKYWRQLLFTQHHDLQVCGAWWSQKHETPLVNIGIEYCNNIIRGIDSLRIESSEDVIKTVQEKGVQDHTLTVTSTGELKILVDDIEHNLGGYFSVWKDNKLYDSRESVNLVQHVSDNQWIIEGSISTVGFVEVVTASDQIDIDVTFDFGSGQLFGPQEPAEGYHLDHSKKLCVVFPLNPHSLLIRNTPFFFEETTVAEFCSLSWVGIESDLLNYAIISQEPAGFHFDTTANMLYRPLAWCPKTWLYDSDDSITRNGHKHLAITGKHTVHYSIRHYERRVDVARIATHNISQKLSWLKTGPDEIIATALFVRNRRLYLRLWNAASYSNIAILEIDGSVNCYPVDLNLTRSDDQTGNQGFKMRPWQILTIEIERD